MEEGGGVWLCQDKFYLIPLPSLAAVNLLYYPTLTWQRLTCLYFSLPQAIDKDLFLSLSD